MAESEEQRHRRSGRSRDAWREVGEQFEALGRSVGRALRMTWESETTRRPLLTALRQMDADLQTLIERLEREEQAAGAAVRIPVEGPATPPDMPVGTLEVADSSPEGNEHVDLVISDPEDLIPPEQ